MKEKVLWESVLEDIKQELNDDGAFVAWFKPIEVLSLTKEKIKLLVPDEFFLKWFKKNYMEFLERAIHKINKNIKIEIVSGEGGNIKKISREEKKKEETLLFGYLDPRFTFDTFVVGKSNEFAYAACRAVCEEPGTRYNPLFIYGGVGLGKTHLLNATGHRILQSKKRLRTCCITAEQFINDFVRASLNNKIIEFQNFYRKSFDVLLVDDIHHLEGKSGSQDQFFHIFNIFFNTKKQIVLTSDKYPQNLSKMEERLKNRFEQGLVVDIKPPEFETRVAIVRKKALLDNVDISENVASYLVEKVNATNIRQLEGALVRVIAYASMSGRAIDTGLIDEALHGFIQEKKRITEDDILEAVSRHFNIKVAEIKSKKRKKHILFPRQISMFLFKELLGLSYPEIGWRFGGKDHTTVIHAVNKIKTMLQRDEHLRETIDSLKKMLS